MQTDPALAQRLTPAAMGPLARIEFAADFDEVRKAIAEAMEALAPLGLDGEKEGAIQILLAEALNNVVEHAYPPGTSGNVTLILRARQSGLMIEIRDRGRPMPEGRAPVGRHPSSRLVQYPPEGGFGWFLIRELASDLVYDRRDGENYLIFRMALARPDDGATQEVPAR